jgi:hypothetical protein
MKLLRFTISTNVKKDVEQPYTYFNSFVSNLLLSLNVRKILEMLNQQRAESGTKHI